MNEKINNPSEKPEMAQDRTILVTGVAGFIGFHLARRLLGQGETVVGLDNLNNYYDVQLKKDRLAILQRFPRFSFVLMDLADSQGLAELFRAHDFCRVVNLAAQAGVRYSLTHPQAYVDSNLRGFLNILEGCRHSRTPHLVFASSSSVYGLNTRLPFSTHGPADHPISLYGATKRANELMAHSYGHLFKMPITGLRFFTVYGPWGRPDMALSIFARSICEGRPISLFNYGRSRRDFTYIDDIVEGVVRIMDKIPTPDTHWSDDSPTPASSSAPYRIFNIGSDSPVDLMLFIETLETALGRQAIKEFLPLPVEDVPATWADIQDLEEYVGFRPSTTVQEGVGKFVEWFLEYYKI